MCTKITVNLMLSSENGDNLETTTSESQMKTLKIKYIYLVIY